MTYSTFYSIAFICVLIVTIAFGLTDSTGTFHAGWMSGAVGVLLLNKVVQARHREVQS